MSTSIDSSSNGHSEASTRPVTVAVIGGGQRGYIYSSWCAKNPAKAKVVAVCEPRPYRLSQVADQNDVPEDLRFTDWRPLAAKGKKIADAVVIAILDGEHAECVEAFAELGYAILCEKPMATSISDCLSIVQSVRRNSTIFGIGHVLRYSPYNVAVKRIIDSGILGEIVNVQHIEPVGREHFAHSYVRGNWRRVEGGTFSLMAKSCHDLDIINYYLSDSKEPRALSSFGALQHFTKAKKPVEAGKAKYCVDCDYEDKCAYSAKKIYLNPIAEGALKRATGEDVWATHIVDAIPDIENVSDAISARPRAKAAQDALLTKMKGEVKEDEGLEGRWGRCVYEGVNDVADQQVVNIQYEDGSTAGFTMVAFTENICERQTRIHGSKGELIGNMKTFTVTSFIDNKTEDHTPASEGGGHGGGDAGIMRSFIEAVATGDQSKLGVTPEDVLRSHLMVFAAEEARLTDEVVKYAKFKKGVYEKADA